MVWAEFVTTSIDFLSIVIMKVKTPSDSIWGEGGGLLCHGGLGRILQMHRVLLRVGCIGLSSVPILVL